jgi:Holliday junction resolvase RusA-like endonuclease
METATKKTASFTIKGRLNGLNDYTKACRSNRYAGAKMKEKNEDIVKIAAWHNSVNGIVVSFTGKVHITYKWYEQNKRRDLDNIAFAKKFIQDALVDMCVLKGDGWQHIVGFTDEFYIDKDNPRIEVIIREV